MNTRKPSFWKGLAFYAGAVAVLIVVCLSLREQPQAEPFGDLEGRFDSKITFSDGNTILHYRETELTNLLLIGVDRTETAQEHTATQAGGQADFLLLLTADRENREINLTQIDRDTITEMETYGVFGDPAGSITTQICLSHAFGTTETQRCENTVAAVSRLFGGIVLDGYIAMDMGDIALLNDTLGGVTVTLEDDFSGVDAAMTPGKTMTLVGKQAEIFVRYRSMIANSTNENRMKRQRDYMGAVLTMVADGDASFLRTLLETMDARICTNLTENTLADDLARWQKYERNDIQTMSGVHTTDEAGFVAFYPDEDWMKQYLLEHFYQ